MGEHCEKDAKPLQILALGAEHENDVHLILDNLALICKILRNHRAELVSIIGVMGAYRTGKSFLLDLLLRRMRSKSREDAAKNAHKRESGDNGASLEEDKWKYDDEKMDRPLPSWVYEGNATHIVEGKPGKARTGFEYRGGPQRCTQGIWIWSHPFVFINNNNQRVAVLLMDTQGAWDDTLTEHQSATIFGLTAMLSSKLIYNIQNRIDETHLDNLDYFTTLAQTANINLLSGENPFGHLEIVVRDWCNYEEGWNFQQCHNQMMEHLKEHMGGECSNQTKHLRDQRLQSMFRQIGCHGLVHPSLKLVKENWDGAIKDINPDYFFLLDDFCNTFFAGDFLPSSPLGCELTVAGFESSLKDCVGAALLRELPEEVYDPRVLESTTNRIKDQYVRDFSDKLKLFRLSSEDLKGEIEKFIQQVDEPINVRVERNNKVVESGTNKLMATPVVGLTVFFISNHHIIIYVGVPVVTYNTLKKHANKKEMRMFSPEVLKAAGNDGKIFMMDRYRDVKAIVIASKCLTPERMQGSLESTSQNAVLCMTTLRSAGGRSTLSSS